MEKIMMVPWETLNRGLTVTTNQLNNQSTNWPTQRTLGIDEKATRPIAPQFACLLASLDYLLDRHAPFACVLCCTGCTHLLACSLWSLWEKDLCPWIKCVDFMQFNPWRSGALSQFKCALACVSMLVQCVMIRASRIEAVLLGLFLSAFFSSVECLWLLLHMVSTSKS